VKEYLEGKKELYAPREGAIEEDVEDCAICLAQFTQEKEDWVVVLDCAKQT